MSRTKWSDGIVGQELKAFIKRVVRSEIERMRPAPRYGTFQGTTAEGKALVQYAGASGPVPVDATLAPDLDVGTMVRVSGVPGARYLDTSVTGGGTVVNPPVGGTTVVQIGNGTDKIYDVAHSFGSAEIEARFWNLITQSWEYPEWYPFTPGLMRVEFGRVLASTGGGEVRVSVRRW